MEKECKVVLWFIDIYQEKLGWGGWQEKGKEREAALFVSATVAFLAKMT